MGGLESARHMDFWRIDRGNNYWESSGNDDDDSRLIAHNTNQINSAKLTECFPTPANDA